MVCARSPRHTTWLEGWFFKYTDYTVPSYVSRKEDKKEQPPSHIVEVIWPGAPINPPPQIHNKTIPRDNENSCGAATPDDNGEQPPAMNNNDEDNNSNDNDNNNDNSNYDNEDRKKIRVKKWLLRQKCQKSRSSAIVLPVGMKMSPPFHQQQNCQQRRHRTFSNGQQ